MALILALLPVPPASAQAKRIVANSSFERPKIPGGGFVYFEGIPGWKLTRGSTGTVIEVQREVYGTAVAGKQLVELDSDASTGIQQVLATDPGQCYVVEFAFSPRPKSDSNQNRLEVSWNGDIVGTFEGGPGGAETAWTRHELVVEASETETPLELRDAGSPQDGLGTYIDDIHVRAGSLNDFLSPLELECLLGELVSLDLQ